MKHHEKKGFVLYVLVNSEGQVKVLQKMDLGPSLNDRLFEATSIVATFNDGSIEVAKERKPRKKKPDNVIGYRLRCADGGDVYWYRKDGDGSAATVASKASLFKERQDAIDLLKKDPATFGSLNSSWRQYGRIVRVVRKVKP